MFMDNNPDEAISIQTLIGALDLYNTLFGDNISGFILVFMGKGNVELAEHGGSIIYDGSAEDVFGYMMDCIEAEQQKRIT